MTNQRLSFIIGLIVSILMISIIAWQTDISDVLIAAQQIGINALLLRVVLYITGLAIRGWRWHVLVEKQLSIMQGFWLFTIGLFFNNVLPFRSGEVVRVAAASTTTELKVTSATASIIVERLFDFVAVLTFLSISLVALDLPAGFRQIGILLTMGTIAALSVIALLARYPEFVMSLGSRILSWLPRITEERAYEFLQPFATGISTLTSVSALVKPLLLSYLAWAVTALSIWALLRDFWADAPLIIGLALTASVGLGVAIPSAPASIGTFESAVLLVLVSQGYDADIALSYAIILHTTGILTVAVVGLLGMTRLSLNLSSLMNSTQPDKPESEEPI